MTPHGTGKNSDNGKRFFRASASKKKRGAKPVMLEAYCCPHASVLLWVHGLRNSRDAFEKVRVFVVILGNHLTMFLFL